MSKKNAKKKTRRSEVKYPALDPKYMPKVRQEYADIDYVDQLTEDEKAWLNKFIDEELNASFKNDERDLTQDPEKKREIYANNNARNRCLYGITKASNLVSDEIRPENDTKVSNYNLYEDAVIAELDKKLGKD